MTALKGFVQHVEESEHAEGFDSQRYEPEPIRVSYTELAFYVQAGASAVCLVIGLLAWQPLAFFASAFLALFAYVAWRRLGERRWEVLGTFTRTFVNCSECQRWDAHPDLFFDDKPVCLSCHGNLSGRAQMLAFDAQKDSHRLDAEAYAIAANRQGAA